VRPGTRREVTEFRKKGKSIKMIQTEKWKPSPDDPGKKIYDGQRTAREVFDDLETYLTSIGYLPDEHFLFNDSRWGNGREFPADGYLTNQVEYGGSEGVWLSMMLEYKEHGEQRWERFATGKTLGESGDDLDRMNLIASAITKAFYGDGVHARYIAVGDASNPEGITVHLSPEERRVVADGLAHRRESLAADDPDAPLTERLLNRINGVAAGQEQSPTRGVLFSRVRLQTDTGEEADFYMSGVPRSYDDLEDDPEFIDFTEFISVSNAKTIDAAVTVYTEGTGAPRTADPSDIDRISKAAAGLDTECDPQIAFGWREVERFNFAFDYDADELFGQDMGGYEL